MVCQRGSPLGQAKNKHIFKKQTDFNKKSPCRNENNGCNEGRYERKGKDMRKRFSKALTLVLALTVVCTSFSFASAATATKKVVVGTPEITYVGCGFYTNTESHSPKEEEVTDIWGFTIDWSAVKGAAGYETQINYKRDGKWSGWKNYYYDKDRNLVEEGSRRIYFDTYEKRLKETKAELKRNNVYPAKKGYIWRYGTDKDGNNISKKYTVSQYMKKFYPKTRASIAVCQDDTIYKFRVRAYKTVNGKKVYGKWSKEQTAKEKITAENIDYIYESVLANVRAWAKQNYPNFDVQDKREGAWDEALDAYPGYAPEGGSYYIVGSQRDTFSRYATPEAVIDYLTESYEDYIEDVSAGGGNENAYLFIRQMRYGSPCGLGSTYPLTCVIFKTWILY